jgi:uncharacterized protein (TIGR02145 family)
LASSLSATNNAAGSTNLRTNGLFMYSGTWGGGWYGQDYYGYYWSSTAYPSDAYDAYYLNFNGTAVYPADYNAKDYGFAVRCVKDAPTPALQTITAANCPSARTMARDARDDHTYLVRRIGDLCWMETNLAYGGGGTNLYGDVISDLTLGTSGVNIADGQACYGEYYEMDEFGAKCYWIPSGSNVTSGSTAPSTSTDGTGQFGYLYSWCTAMNGQIGACSISTGNPQPDQSINGGTAATQYNICPTGWRLPTDGELLALNSAINGGSTTSSSGLLSNGLFMYGGGWYRGSKVSAGRGSYWTSVQNSSSRARYLDFSSTSLAISTVGDKGSGNAVRCVAP